MAEAVAVANPAGGGEEESIGQANAVATPPKAAPKPKRPPNAPMPPQAQEAEVVVPKKKFGWLKLIIVAGATILVAGFVTGCIVFNLFGVRDGMRDFLVGIVVGLDPEFSAIDETLILKNEQRTADLDKRETELNAFEAELSEIEAGLTEIEDRLNARETQLDRRSVELDKKAEQMVVTEDVTVPRFMRNLPEPELERLRTTSLDFTNMSPEEAVDILLEIKDINEVATILYFMRPRNRAPILVAMDAPLAAELTLILLTGQNG